jgi:hypothetical protein
VFFGGLGYQGPKTTLFNENIGLLALPPSAARPINQYFIENVCFFDLGTPGLQKTTWPINHYGIPLKIALTMYLEAYLCHKGRLGWSGASGFRQNR